MKAGAVRHRIGQRIRAANFAGRLARYLGSGRLLRRWAPVVERWDPAPGRRAVVLAPHMDDEVIGCGGTLARMIAAGSEVSVVFFTDGRYGDRALDRMREDERAIREQALVAIRQEEARCAAKVLGISSLTFLGIEDSRLRPTTAVRDRLRELLRAANPDVVFYPFVLEEHSDHRATAELLAAAVAAGAFSFECLAYEVWTPLFPNCVVDVTETFPAKEKALAEYRSQLTDTDFVRIVRGLNAYRSVLIDGRGFAEAFWRCPASALGAMREWR